MIGALLFLCGSGRAADVVPTELDQARRTTTVGAIELGVGGVAVVGGLGVMLVGRGAPGELSDETPFVHDGRTVAGVVLVVGGLTSVLVGSGTLAKGVSQRRQATGTTAWVAPFPVRRGAGLLLDVRF